MYSVLCVIDFGNRRSGECTMTREDLLKLLREAGVDYQVKEQDGHILKVNFWVEKTDASDS